MKGCEMFIPPIVLYHRSADGIQLRITRMTQIHQLDLRHLRLNTLLSLVEAADESGLADDMAFHGG